MVAVVAVGLAVVVVGGPSPKDWTFYSASHVLVVVIVVVVAVVVVAMVVVVWWFCGLVLVW